MGPGRLPRRRHLGGGAGPPADPGPRRADDGLRASPGSSRSGGSTSVTAPRDVLVATAIHVGAGGTGALRHLGPPDPPRPHRPARPAAGERGRDGGAGAAAGLPPRPPGRPRHGGDGGRRARRDGQGAARRGAGRRPSCSSPTPAGRTSAGPRSPPAASAPGCGVETPWGCPAVRRGRTLYFESSDDLSACPRLSDRDGEPCSAVCVPDHDPRDADRRHPRHRARRPAALVAPR